MSQPVSDAAYFFGAMGSTCALVFACFGAAYGTAKSAIGISAMGVMRPEIVMKCTIPVIMAGALAIYGLILSLIVGGNVKEGSYSMYKGFLSLSAGLSTGLSCLAAGMAIGIVGDAGVRAVGQQPKLFTAMVLILIFAEALGIYGLIIGLTMGLGH
eukprot:TRINITY_DN17221_c0_g1_i1.p1 TRINITY_DN17221_c0_g1~~TRINITY_DN17221_c0_g1_i1.p1  ORF type:complete len:156 (+),score=27.02 TRINITY_DN17221_c0_g1_i1:77-544(+)